jgi:transposase InsO family protein
VRLRGSHSGCGCGSPGKDPARIDRVIDALGMAITRRNPDRQATILHSDHGSQFTSWAFGRRLVDAGIVPSMGSIGDCYDNSLVESFWGAMQLELLDFRIWRTRTELATAIFEWIECWYNPFRRHSDRMTISGLSTRISTRLLWPSPSPATAACADSNQPGLPKQSVSEPIEAVSAGRAVAAPGLDSGLGMRKRGPVGRGR